MSLSKEQVSQIAYLARLSVNAEQLDDTTNDLNNILHLVDELSKANTDEIAPMAHPLHMSQRLREDKVSESDDSDNFQSIAPKTGKKHYLVPTVIE